MTVGSTVGETVCDVMENTKDGTSSTPTDQALRGGNGGIVPPVEHRWPKGTSGNPKGRPTAGASQREWWNVLAAADLTRKQLQAIVHDEDAPHLKRTAAEQILLTKMPVLAQYEGLVNGTQTLTDLEASGVDTSVVKKVKERQEYGKEGSVIAVTREIELHALAGEALDRICDRTDGRPTQRVDMKHEGNLRTNADGQAAADAALAALETTLGT